MRVELPLAFPVIVTGVRVATVTTVGLVGISVVIQLGGLASLIFDGYRRQFTTPIVVGSALSILLAGLTIVFLLAVVTLQPFAMFSGAEQEMVVLVALLVCLIPTTIGGLLSAIGIAGMDRLVQRNVLAMSGRAVEAAGQRIEYPVNQRL